MIIEIEIDPKDGEIERKILDGILYYTLTGGVKIRSVSDGESA